MKSLTAFLFAAIFLPGSLRALGADEDRLYSVVSGPDDDTRPIRQRLSCYLMVTPGELARLWSKPHYGRERVFSVYATGSDEAAPKHFITVTAEPTELDPAIKGLQMERTDRPVSEALALAIHRVWAKALLARHREKGRGVIDGDRIYLTAKVDGQGELLGDASDATRPGAVMDLLHLEEALERFAADKDADEKVMLDKVTVFEKTMPQP